MNARVLRLLADYFQRTLAAWLLLAVAHVMQLTAFWATHVERVPLLGVIAASLAYFTAFESPHTVLRTLPLSRADIALFRWWASIGAPALVVLLCTSLAWLVSGENGWARPSQDDVTLYGFMACACIRKHLGHANVFWRCNCNHECRAICGMYATAESRVGGIPWK